VWNDNEGSEGISGEVQEIGGESMNREARINNKVAFRFDIREAIHDAKVVRGKLSEAMREMKGLMEGFRGENREIWEVVQGAMRAVEEAVKATDQVIGMSLSEQSDKEMGFISRDRRAGRAWTSIQLMRQDIDLMMIQVFRWMNDEREAVDSGRAGISHVRRYGFAYDVLEECGRKLRQVEREI
jgi:hypothetical protein